MSEISFCNVSILFVAVREVGKSAERSISKCHIESISFRDKVISGYKLLFGLSEMQIMVFFFKLFLILLIKIFLQLSITIYIVIGYIFFFIGNLAHNKIRLKW